MTKIPKIEFARRRTELMKQMGAGSIAIVPAAALSYRNSDVGHTYRQASNFQYLTGFPEPEAVAVLIPGRAQGEYVLFCRSRDPKIELWDGARAGQEGAISLYDANVALSIEDIDTQLPELMDGCERVFYGLGAEEAFDARVVGWINAVRAKARQGANPPSQILDIAPMLSEMRLIKSPAEVSVMREASKLSAKAHVRAMALVQPGLYEYHLEAELRYAFSTGGARHIAYGSIVGAGANACVLHYVDNDKRIEDGDLVLIDAACELDCYASDITRTFPANGTFTAAQRAVYQVVLDAQLAAIAQIKPGNCWNDVHDAAVRSLTTGLVALGLLEGDVDTLIAEGTYKEFYMHTTGHWLGLDVHDVGRYKIEGAWRALEPGMVFTVEPGLYIAPDNRSVDPVWRGIGVRIEDVVVVTAEGVEVLTLQVAKEAHEIEALIKRAQATAGSDRQAQTAAAL